MFKDRDLEIARLLAGIFNAVGKIAADFLDTAGKDRVIEILDQPNAPRVARPGAGHQIDLRWKRSRKAGQHDQRAAALDAGVARRDGDFLSCGHLGHR